MKRFIGILGCAIAFSACDDGDLVVDTINFDAVTTTTCGDANNLLFKLKDAESLILNVPDGTFKENATAENTPIELTINPSNQVVYNFYDGKVTADKICGLIPPAAPNTKTQWNASSGVIEITTETVKTSNETEKSTRITGYKHNIIFKNITFTKKDGSTQFYESFVFGDYLKPITPLPLAFDKVLVQCTNSGLVYESNATESLTLTIDPALIINEPTLTDKPRTGTIGPVKNKLVYRLFNSVVPPEYFCASKEPPVPTVKEEWLGKTGGSIEVTTTTVTATTFKHTIVFKNVSLEKGNSSFLLGNNYKYGDLQK